MDATILPFAQRDIRDALPEFLAARAGFGKPEHPAAEEMLGRRMALHQIAANYLTGTRGMPPSEIISRALTSSDFGNDVATAFQRVAVASFDAAVSGYEKLVRRIAVPDFKPARVPTLSVGDFEERPEHSEWTHTAVRAGSVLEEAGVITQGELVTISRQSLVNDDAGQIAAVARQYGNAASLSVAKAIADVLADTGNLDDASPLFHADHSNLLTGGAAPAVSSIDAAMASLYRQPTPAGGISGASPAYLVVPPELAATGYVTMLAIFGDAVRPDRVETVVLPHLSSTSEWYLMSSPAQAPVLGMLTLGLGSPLLIERQTETVSDAVGMKARIDFRIVRLSRTGAVKQGA